MWHPDSYIQGLIDSYEKQWMERRKTESWPDMKARIRDGLKRVLGSFESPDGDIPALQPVELERVDKGDYVREKVEYTTAEGLRVPAYVLVPKTASGKRLPAVVGWAGHGTGHQEAVGLRHDGSERDETEGAGIHNDFAIKLVRRGMLVLVPETVGFGVRRMANPRMQREKPNDPAHYNSCYALSALLMLMGKSLVGLRVYEAFRAVDYLLTRPDVDAGRIGCVGFSGGGMVTSYYAALDERVRATVIHGYTNTFKGGILRKPHCMDNYIPGLMELGDLPDILGLIAPRALFVESGLRDGLFPADQVREAVDRLKEIYRLEGAEGELDWELFDGGHMIKGERSYDWLKSKLEG